MHKRVLALFLALPMGVAGTAAAGTSAAQKAIAPTGATQLVAVSGKSRVEARVITRVIQRGDPRHRLCEGRAGACSGVEDLVLTLDGEPVFVSGSVFADLGDPRRIELVSKGALWTLVLRGGDASASYFVEVAFARDGIHTRKFYSAMEPDKPLEVTSYFEVVTD